MPWSSGPRCCRLAAIASATLSTLPPPMFDAAPTKPAMPHIEIVPPRLPIDKQYRADQRQTMKFLSNAQSTALPPARSFSKSRGAVLALKIIVTLACLWYLFDHIDVAELRRSLPEFQAPWAILTVSLLMLQIPLVALRWLEIVNVLKIHGERLTYLWISAGTAIGQFFGQILPAVAGDGVRVWFLTHFGSDWRDAAVSVVIDRCVGVGLLLVFAFAILLLPSHLDLFAGYRGEVVAALGAMLFAGVIVLVLGARFGPVIATWRSGKWIASFFTASYRA